MRNGCQARRYSVAIAIATLSLALAGCSADPFMDREQERGFPSSEEALAQVDLGRVLVTWPHDLDLIQLTTEGSSSCPLVPYRTLDDEVLELRIDTGGSAACSADLSPVTSTVERPSGWPTGVSLEMTSTDDDSTIFITTQK